MLDHTMCFGYGFCIPSAIGYPLWIAAIMWMVLYNTRGRGMSDRRRLAQMLVIGLVGVPVFAAFVIADDAESASGHRGILAIALTAGVVAFAGYLAWAHHR